MRYTLKSAFQAAATFQQSPSLFFFATRLALPAVCPGLPSISPLPTNVQGWNP